MRCGIFQLGSLYLGDTVQHVPQQPDVNGDIPVYSGNGIISIGETAQGKSITWIKPDGMNLLVCDRVILTDVSWDDLDKNKLVFGKKLTIRNRCFLCRLPQVGRDIDNYLNEWDFIMNITGESDSLWHWKKEYFLGQDTARGFSTFMSVRGFYSARTWNDTSCDSRTATTGFRPVLEILPSERPTANCCLDGQKFYWSNIADSRDFCPILQPIGTSVFAGIPNGTKVKMYSIIRNGEPIQISVGHIPKFESPCHLQLVDHYFGEEFLVPWVISNGVAVASHVLFQQYSVKYNGQAQN